MTKNSLSQKFQDNFKQQYYFSFLVFALLCNFFYALPIHQSINLKILDLQFDFLQQAYPQKAKKEVVIVGIDTDTLQTFIEPMALWHRHLGLFFTAMAQTKPSVLGIDIGLPDKSYDKVVPGYDKALMHGLLALRQAKVPLVLALSEEQNGDISKIYAPFISLAGGVASQGSAALIRDIDQTVRFFTENIGHQGQSIPTLTGQMARKIDIQPINGMINYGYGESFNYIPLHQINQLFKQGDHQQLAQMFANKAVILGTVLPVLDRYYHPMKLAAWENRDKVPGVLIQAKILRNQLNHQLITPISFGFQILYVNCFILLCLLIKSFHKMTLIFLASSSIILTISTAGLLSGFYLQTSGPLIIGFFAILLMLALQSYHDKRLATIERKQAEIDKYSAQENAINTLKKADQLKDEFLANTSHELRTPLHGIIGMAESMLISNDRVSEKFRENLQLIIQSGNRLGNLVNDILDFSKLNNQHIELNIKTVCMKSLVNLVLTMSQSLIGNKDLQLINKIDDQLPYVMADEERLQQILFNLVGNAIKFTRQGQVIINANESNGKVFVSVMDDGIGIPNDKLNTIFESFEQVDGSIEREFGGTGLGLCITKQLIELHGGTIIVKSKLGKGSKFIFSLPVSTEKALPTPVTSPHEKINVDLDKLKKSLIQETSDEIIESPTTQPSGFIERSEEILVDCQSSAMNILIVDDEPINRQILKNLLSCRNCQIEMAEDGELALQQLKQGYRPDIILLDIMMPKMNGFEVCKEIRKDFDPTELPIIFLSAKNQINDFVSGLEIGGNDYLMKPFSKNELLARIKSHWSMAKIHSSNNRFVPKEFLGLLGHENILDINLGDHTEMMMTVLFSDIRSFTSISEKMSPEQNFNFVNDYFSYMGSVIRDNTGFIDKYIGDAIMALFPDSPNHSVNAAIKMQQAVTQFNSDFKNIYDEVSIGIGMHHGNVMLGTVGDSDRMEGTVISDSVNLSSRIEGLCKTYGAGILMTSGVLKKISQAEQYQIRYLGKIQVKGKNTTTLLYEIMDGLADAELKHKLASQKTFELGLDYYYQLDFESARKHFATALEIFAEDKAAILYHSRCQQHIDHPTEYSENFVDAMTTK